MTASPEVARADIAQNYAMAEQAPVYQAILAKGVATGVIDASLIGDEDDVLARLRRFAEVGVTEFVASPIGAPAAARAIARARPVGGRGDRDRPRLSSSTAKMGWNASGSSTSSSVKAGHFEMSKITAQRSD